MAANRLTDAVGTLLTQRTSGQMGFRSQERPRQSTESEQKGPKESLGVQVSGGMQINPESGSQQVPQTFKSLG